MIRATVFLLFSMLLLTGCKTAEQPQITPSPFLTPIPTLAPTELPLPSPPESPTTTPHPDYNFHYISREYIDGYESMSEAQIQALLDMYDSGYIDRDIEAESEKEDEHDYGYEEGYADGYDDGYKEGYDKGMIDVESD